LARQLNLEKKAKSIRILTPTLSNAIVNEKYLEDLCRSQYPDEKEVVNCMYARRDNLEAGLRDGKFDVRALFLRKSVDNDLITNCTENNIERYRYLISMVRDYGLDLKFRLISDMTVEQTKEKEFSFALIYSEEPKPHVDVATAYATQASTDFFSIHMIEINTDRVKRNSFEFERLWASAWSEKNSLNYIEKLLSGEK
jgi:hypothetical protein